jgi:hypothetical protein
MREYDNTNVLNLFNSGSSIDDNNYHHVVLSFTPNNAGLYVDGRRLWMVLLQHFL